jgi:hypothetical protein
MRQNQKTAKFKAVPTARNMMNDRQAGMRSGLFVLPMVGVAVTAHTED